MHDILHPHTISNPSCSSPIYLYYIGIHTQPHNMCVEVESATFHDSLYVIITGQTMQFMRGTWPVRLAECRVRTAECELCGFFVGGVLIMMIVPLPLEIEATPLDLPTLDISCMPPASVVVLMVMSVATRLCLLDMLLVMFLGLLLMAGTLLVP